MRSSDGGSPAAALVVVSPHLDDAVLSAAVPLMRPGAHVVTVFAGAPPEGTPPADWDQITGATDPVLRVRERFVEDDRALAVLGVAGTTRLAFPDAQHVADPADRTPHDQLVSALAPLLAGADEVWAPSAIGGHPDHIAARDAAVAAAGPTTTVHHYADLPYSLSRHWPRPEVRDWGGDAVASDEFVRTVHQLDPDAQRRKVAAMACYETQLTALELDQVLATRDPEVVGVEISWTRR